MSAVVLDDVSWLLDWTRDHPGEGQGQLSGVPLPPLATRSFHTFSRFSGPVTGISDACSACSVGGFGRDRSALGPACAGLFLLMVWVCSPPDSGRVQQAGRAWNSSQRGRPHQH